MCPNNPALVAFLPVLRSDRAFHAQFTAVLQEVKTNEQARLSELAVAALVRPELMSAAQAARGRVELIDQLITQLGASDVTS